MTLAAILQENILLTASENTTRMISKKTGAFLGWFVLLLCTGTVCFFLGIILADLITKGWPALSWEFISSGPTEGMTTGGILPAIVGTVLTTVITAIFAVPFGVCCAIYLNEYAKDTSFSRLIRASIRNLSGVPSIIYGLFGLALFVQGLSLGTSVLSAGLTLGLLSLPYIITTTEEALRRVPASMRKQPSAGCYNLNL